MNPYYAEWVRRTGGGPNHEYIIWNWQMWSEWRREFSKPKFGASEEDRAHFLDWLTNRL